ncbi:Endonuclease/exonuclease/phosphatase family protein [Acinetobacter junii]|uniref:endonuclease/exonuclease/phosphatase family protein n=1 Tax=Acinetobacter junii TaxID=40215 RepID=UPI001AF64FA4|nr:endonuclease/exonuclease/phosphatase family protein [Acinetobacter junii]QQV65201.1 Endonuclease/exonuclease/phosphatase family protein [Acinetobacter junii]
MKILTWNCNGAFRKKIELLKEIDADIYIIQECESEEKSQRTYDSWLPNRIWKGHNKNKGLGVFAKEQFKLEQLYWEDSNLELFLPLKINDDFQLLAVWTKYANSPTFQYIGQLWKYLQLHNTAIATKATIICGDLNSNAQWDVWDRWWNHSDVVNQLKTMNIHSLYHELTNEEQGKEKNSTFFMNRNQEKIIISIIYLVILVYSLEETHILKFLIKMNDFNIVTTYQYYSILILELIYLI